MRVKPQNFLKLRQYQRVRWEHLKKPDLFQCKNCQRIEHAIKNCHLPFRCVKCAQTHTPGACSINSHENRPALKCANCNQSGHPASYKGCPFLKYALAKKKEFKALKYNNNLQKINRISLSIRENLCFAQAVNNGKQHPQPCKASTPFSSHPRRASFHPTSSGSLFQQEDNANADPPPPRWVSSLKEEIAAMVTSQFQTLASQIAANTNQIEFILNSLFSKDNV